MILFRLSENMKDVWTDCKIIQEKNGVELGGETVELGGQGRVTGDWDTV